MNRKRAVIAVLACALALVGLGLSVFRSFEPANSLPDEDAAASQASSSPRHAAERRLSRRRPTEPLVSPRAEAERASGAASIAGRVVDDVSGRGVANAALTFLRGGVVSSADADKDGRFAFERLEPGVYELYTINAPGYAPFQSDLGPGGITLRVEPDTRLRDVTFSLRALWVAEGTVTGPTGAPVAGADVSGLDGDAEPVTTDAQGRFGIDCSLGAVLEARHARFAPGKATCDRSAQLGRPLAIRLAEPRAAAAQGSIAGPDAGADGGGVENAGGRLEGSVRERGGTRPIAGFSIVLWPMRGALERGPAVVRTFFAPDGRFDIDALLPGDYTVTALAAGWPSAEERRVAIAAGISRDVLLELVPGGRVFGAVRDAATGRPITGAQIALESTLGDERSAVPLLASSASDEQGAFELRGVGAARFSLSVSAAEHHHKLLTGLSLRGGELGPLRIDLDPTAPGEAPKLELYGIGAVLRVQGDAIIVADVVAQSGAARAGLALGDRILAVDGTPVAALGFHGTIEHIRGPEGTAVRLQVRRGETDMHLVAERSRVRR